MFRSRLSFLPLPPEKSCFSWLWTIQSSPATRQASLWGPHCPRLAAAAAAAVDPSSTPARSTKIPADYGHHQKEGKKEKGRAFVSAKTQKESARSASHLPPPGTSLFSRGVVPWHEKTHWPRDQRNWGPRCRWVKVTFLPVYTFRFADEKGRKVALDKVQKVQQGWTETETSERRDNSDLVLGICCKYAFDPTTMVNTSKCPVFVLASIRVWQN
jgi:hypothetical protein